MSAHCDRDSIDLSFFLFSGLIKTILIRSLDRPYTMPQKCINSPNSFCYICGEFTVADDRRSITTNIKKLYQAYFGIKLDDQDISFAPHIVCKSCRVHQSYECGTIKNSRAFLLVFRWYIGSKKIISMTVIFVW